MIETVQYELNDTIGTLRLCNEPRHNALGEGELKALEQTLATIRGDSQLRALIVTGSGDKTFCAGALLDDLNSRKITPEYFQQVMQQIADLPIPTIARVNGNIFGGGVELALACDYRIGVQGSRVRVPAAALGLCYPPQGITRFVEKLGANLPRRLLLGAETIQATELHRLGFFDDVVSSERLDERVDEFAIHLDGLAPLAVKAMKELIRNVEAGQIDKARAEELFKQCDESADLQEGFAAMREKRAPGFLGT